MTQITPTGWGETGKWNGTPVDGSPFTEQQLAILAAKGIDPATVETHTVRLRRPRERTAAEFMAMKPLSQCFDIAEVRCPIVERRPAHDIVATPGGDSEWMRR